MNQPLLILPAKEQTGRNDGAGKENREVAGLIVFVLAAFHTAQELSRRQPASTAAGTETRRGRSKDSYVDRSRRSDKAGRGSRVHTNHRTSEDRDTGSRPGDDKGRLLFFPPTHPPNRVY